MTPRRSRRSGPPSLKAIHCIQYGHYRSADATTSRRVSKKRVTGNTFDKVVRTHSRKPGTARKNSSTSRADTSLCRNRTVVKKPPSTGKRLAEKLEGTRFFKLILKRIDLRGNFPIQLKMHSDDVAETESDKVSMETPHENVLPSNSFVDSCSTSVKCQSQIVMEKLSEEATEIPQHGLETLSLPMKPDECSNPNANGNTPIDSREESGLTESARPTDVDAATGDKDPEDEVPDEEGACEVTLTYPDDELEKNLMAKDTVEVVTPANVSHEIIHAENLGENAKAGAEEESEKHEQGIEVEAVTSDDQLKIQEDMEVCEAGHSHSQQDSENKEQALVEGVIYGPVNLLEAMDVDKVEIDSTLDPTAESARGTVEAQVSEMILLPEELKPEPELKSIKSSPMNSMHDEESSTFSTSVETEIDRVSSDIPSHMMQNAAKEQDQKIANTSHESLSPRITFKRYKNRSFFYVKLRSSQERETMHLLMSCPTDCHRALWYPGVSKRPKKITGTTIHPHKSAVLPELKTDNLPEQPYRYLFVLHASNRFEEFQTLVNYHLEPSGRIKTQDNGNAVIGCYQRPPNNGETIVVPFKMESNPQNWELWTIHGKLSKADTHIVLHPMLPKEQAEIQTICPNFQELPEMDKELENFKKVHKSGIGGGGMKRRLILSSSEPDTE